MSELDAARKRLEQAREDIAAAAATSPAPARPEEPDAELAAAYARWLRAHQSDERRSRASLEHELDVWSRKLDRAEANLKHAADHLASRAERKVADIEAHVDRLLEELGIGRVSTWGDLAHSRVVRCKECAAPIADRATAFRQMGFCQEHYAPFAAWSGATPNPYPTARRLHRDHN